MRVLIAASTTVDIFVPQVSALPALGDQEFSTSNLVSLAQAPSLHMGGNGGNAAAVLGALGEAVALYTNLADDFWGRWARDQLEARGVQVLTPPDLPATSVHIAVTDPGFRRLSFFYPGTVVTPAELPPVRVAMFGGCPHPTVEQLAAALPLAAGAATLLDIGPNLGQGFTAARFTPLYPHLDWLTANESEMAAFTGQDPTAGAQAVALRVRQGVVLKRGAGGAAVFFRSGAPPLRAEAFRVTVRHTIGAGDSFNGGLLYGMARGWPWPRILRFANAVAALVVQSPASTLGGPSAPAVRAFLQANPQAGQVATGSQPAPREGREKA